MVWIHQIVNFDKKLDRSKWTNMEKNKGISLGRPLGSGAEISYFGVPKMVMFDTKRPFNAQHRGPREAPRL